MAHHDPVTQDVKTKLQDLGNDAAEALKDNAEQQAQTAKLRAVKEAEKVANAADAAGNEFGAGSIQAQIADQVAMQAEHFAQSIAQLDVNAVSRNVSEFARRNPLLFVGGAAVAGVLAARFLKARDPEPTVVSYPNDDPWGYYPAHPRTGADNGTS